MENFPKFPALLISFEGIDGSGKSTQARLLYEYLKSLGYKVSLYREPGSTELSEKIRELILNFETDPITELFLFETARSSLVWEKVLPDLKEGKIVILDRFIDSTVVYQGYGRRIGFEIVRALNYVATRGKKPDITFLLDVLPEIAVRRIKSERTRFEELGFLKRIRDAYLMVAGQESDRVMVIDGSREKELVFADVLSALRKRFHQYFHLSCPSL